MTRVPDTTRDGVLERPFVHRRGELELPTAPRLGFAIDERALGRWGKRTFVMDKLRLAVFARRDRGLAAAREIDKARRERRAGVKADAARAR